MRDGFCSMHTSYIQHIPQYISYMTHIMPGTSYSPHILYCKIGFYFSNTQIPFATSLKNLSIAILLRFREEAKHQLTVSCTVIRRPVSPATCPATFTQERHLQTTDRLSV